jgi:hypothetical protein
MSAHPLSLFNDIIIAANLPSSADAPQSIGQFVIFAINVLIGVNISLVTLTSAWAMWELIFSTGEPDKIKKVWSMLTWTAIAAVATLLSMGFKYAVFSVAGANPDIINVDPTI